nr:DUF3558 domain-containing protein [Streptoalloteichus tenebrarius]
MVAGCSSSTTGTPTAAEHTSNQTSTAASRSASSPSAGAGPSLAPRVANPKNLRGQDACQLLTPQQQAELTFTKPGEKGTSIFGESECDWSNDNLRIYLALDTKRRGLEETYLRKERFPDFTPSTVAGYPAVRTGLNVRLKSCRVDLGVADDQVLYISFSHHSAGRNPEYEDPCGFAEKVGKMVLDNLPPTR